MKYKDEMNYKISNVIEEDTIDVNYEILKRRNELYIYLSIFIISILLLLIMVIVKHIDFDFICTLVFFIVCRYMDRILGI